MHRKKCFKEMGFTLMEFYTEKKRLTLHVNTTRYTWFIHSHCILCLHKVTLGLAGKIYYRKASFLSLLLGLGIWWWRAFVEMTSVLQMLLYVRERQRQPQSRLTWWFKKCHLCHFRGSVLWFGERIFIFKRWKIWSLQNSSSLESTLRKLSCN